MSFTKNHLSEKIITNTFILTLVKVFFVTCLLKRGDYHLLLDFGYEASNFLDFGTRGKVPGIGFFFPLIPESTSSNSSCLFDI